MNLYDNCYRKLRLTVWEFPHCTPVIADILPLVWSDLSNCSKLFHANRSHYFDQLLMVSFWILGTADYSKESL